MQLIHTNTSWDCDPFDINSLQWWLQWQAPLMRVSATWAQRATRRTIIRRMGIEMSKMCCPAVAKNFPWDLWVIGFVLNSVRSENHKTSWWTAQRHCPAPAKFCHLSTCGRQISPLRTRKRHRVLRYGDRTMAGEMMYFAYLYTRYWLRAEFTKEWRMLLYASLLVR